jgi:hypothetical protein
LFSKTNLAFTSPYDSVAIQGTKLAYLFDKDGIIGDKGRFDWKLLNHENDSTLRATQNRIHADFARYEHFPVSEIHFRAENTTLSYDDRLKDPIKGHFYYSSEKRKNANDLKYPIFTSYYEDAELDDVGRNIVFKGGLALKGFKFYGRAISAKHFVSLDIVKDGKTLFRTKGKEYYIGEDRLYSPSVSFAFYLANGDSLSHSDVSLSYDFKKLKGDTLPAHSFKLFKEKANEDMPFIDSYHKIYITADVGVYNVDKGLFDFYILGASDRISAKFESFSYFNEERYDGLQGSYPFHPLKVIDAYGNNYGSTNANGSKVFNLELALAAEDEKRKASKSKSRTDGSLIKSMILKLARQGYIQYNDVTGEVVVLNRTGHNDASAMYKKAMDRLRKEPKKVLTKDLASFIDHDYDDMLIESVSPRDGKKDVIKLDTIRFDFSRGRMLLAKLEDKDIFFTKRSFQSQPDSTQKDTTYTFTDTLKIEKFKLKKQVLIKEALDRMKLNPNKFDIQGLTGFYLERKRQKGGAMSNATIDANGGGIVIRGIEKFTVSKKLNVNIIPQDKEIRIFGDRVIMLERGEVTVGNFRFIGKNFTLPYDEFKLTMETIDTVLFSVPGSKDSTMQLGAEIRMNSGDLLINNSNNKSGLKTGLIPGATAMKDNYEAYPKLNVETGGRIYFEQFYRLRGAYHKNKAYFDIPAIKLDSLNSHIPKFSGVFYSNILPPIKENLIPIYDANYNGVESKYSLGFIHKFKKPYKIYGTEAELKADSLVMFKTGLVASGKSEIKHFTTVITGKNFTLSPDSLFASNVELNTKQGTIGKAFFPSAVQKSGRMHWYTTQIVGKDTLSLDSLTIRNTQVPFKIFDEKKPASLLGTLAITPSGLWASGTLIRKDFFLYAPKAMKITPERIFTPNITDNIVEFKVNSKEIDPFAKEGTPDYEANPAILQGNATNLDFDLKKEVAKVTPTTSMTFPKDYAFIELPYAQFKTSIKEAVWDLKQKTIVMKSDSAALFTSLKYEKQESDASKDLIFRSVGGIYDIKELDKPSLNLNGVPFIVSADARIYPYKGKVIVLKGADVQPLKQAKLVVDTLNGYHTLIDGNIKINHRLSFEGDATYQYVNVDKDTTRIKFNQFELVQDKKINTKKSKKDTASFVANGLYTKAEGEVRETDKFFITSRIQFRGNVEMLANKKDLLLNGFIRLDLKSKKDLTNSWIPYKRDAGDVYVELEEKTTIETDVLTSGLHYDAFDGKLYTTFLSNKIKTPDADMFLAKGILKYNPAINEFKIAEKEKGEGISYKGKRFVFDDSKASISMEGKVNLVDESLQKSVETSMIAKIDLQKQQYLINTFLVLDFPKMNNAFAQMAEMLAFNKPEGAAVANPDLPRLLIKLAEFTGDKKAKEYETNAQMGYLPLPMLDKTSFIKSLVISNVDLKWLDTTNSFYSTSKIGISNIYGKDINTAYDGYLEIKKNTDGDIINIYIEALNDTWFFFSFHQNVLYAESSLDKFNSTFRAGKKPKKVGEFAFQLPDEGDAERFKKRFKRFYIDGNFKDDVEDKPKEEPKEEDKKKDDKKKDDKDGF